MPSALAAYLVPTTLLQAVNMCLESVSSNTVASLDAEDTNSDAGIATKRIGEALRETCMEGWYWNTDLDIELQPDEDGFIQLPTNTVRFVQRYSTGTTGMRLVIRDGRLYDTINHTYVIDLPVNADLTYIIDFDELPEAVREYITIKACRRFGVGKMASTTVYNFTKSDEDTARLRMEQEAAEVEPESMNENPHIRRLRSRRPGGTWWA
jgi:hypothetical protein